MVKGQTFLSLDGDEMEGHFSITAAAAAHSSRHQGRCSCANTSEACSLLVESLHSLVESCREGHVRPPHPKPQLNPLVAGGVVEHAVLLQDLSDRGASPQDGAPACRQAGMAWRGEVSRGVPPAASPPLPPTLPSRPDLPPTHLKPTMSSRGTPQDSLSQSRTPIISSGRVTLQSIQRRTGSREGGCGVPSSALRKPRQ